MERDSEIVLKYMEEVELVGDKILVDRREQIELDRRRQKLREAIRALQKPNMDDKSWIGIGDIFIKLSKGEAKNLMESDYKKVNELILNGEQQIKTEVSRLQDLENKEKSKGFNLQALSKGSGDLEFVGL